MAGLSLSFLGPFQATLAGQPVAGFASQRVRALLAYLAVEVDRPHPRETLVGLLWPDWPDRSAFANLRQALANLRACIGDRDADPPHLFISRETIQFNRESDHDLDVAAFSALIKGGRGDPPAVERWQQAVGLYRGAFLEGFSLGDSPAFEGWLTLQREQLARQMLEVLGRLAGYHEGRGEYEQAEGYAQRQVALDPTQEEGQRQLMRALALAGQRSAALAQYQSCRRVLAEELGEEPAGETVALYESIRQGGLAGASPTAVGATPSSAGPTIVAAHPLVAQAAALEVEQVPEAPRPLFVAREEELGQLDRWLGLALSGQGRVGFVVGEPGSGKTALAREFARWAMEAHPELIVASGNCNAYFGLGDPYLPFLEVLGMLTADIEGKVAGGSMSREHARRLQGFFPIAVRALLDQAPGLIDLLIPGAGLLARAQDLAPACRARLEGAVQRRTPMAAPLSQPDLFQQVTRVLQAVARERPLLVVLDDLQWADAGSIALLFHLGRRLAGSRILVVGMYRPEEVAQGREGKPHPLEQVVYEFERTWGESQVDLAQAEEVRFVGALLDSEPNRLGAAFRGALYRHTGGQALFTVELWRGLQERGDLLRDERGSWVEGPALNWEQLPKRVDAVIGAHIARLPPEWQELLAVASVEGEEFTAEVLARVQGVDEREVLRALSGGLSAEHRLVRATGLRRVGEGRPEVGQRLSQYRFRHYLFQEYLYQHLDEVERAHLHEEVGVALEMLYRAVPHALTLEADAGQLWTGEWMKVASPQWFETAAVALQLARHFQAAGLAQKAVIYLAQAMERAVLLSALEESLSHLRRALALLPSLPPTPQRTRYECVLQNWLGAVLDCWSHILPEVGQAHARAVELAQCLGDMPMLCLTLRDLARYHRLCGELRLAREFGERAVHLAEGQQEPFPMSMHSDLAQTLLHGGDLVGTCTHLEPLIAPSPEPQPDLPGFLYENYLNDLLHAPWALWCLGYPDRALRVSQAALALAHSGEGDHPIIQVLCDGICFPHQLRREVGAVEQALRELWPLVSKETCVPVMRCFAMLYQGWVHAQRGDLEQGITELRRGLAEWSACYVVLRPHWRGFLAEALARAGRVEEGLETLDEALEQVERTEERLSEAELHRLRGELLLQHGVPEAEAEACFQQAIAVARSQEARSWELRATLSLARLWQRQGKRDDARQVLSAIYGWFTEGFDTPDLQEARALIEERPPRAA